ncbi:hypothetical protein MNV49_003758 [Pseudohyphozyma bogoriensis]|nr:hypothetical protein MNV49_003758 [Pseudohyphozyma bogoriensis]
MEVDAKAPPRGDEYVVVARGTRFVLSRSQVEFDGPNFFTAAFLDHDFSESSSRTLHTDRHPLLFAIICDYLAGYNVLPLQPAALPPTMSVKVGMDNLGKDAEYFQLDKLKEQLDRMTRPSLPIEAVGFARVLEWKELEAGKVLLERVPVGKTEVRAKVVGVEGRPVVLARNVACSLDRLRVNGILYVELVFARFVLEETALAEALRTDAALYTLDFHPRAGCTGVVDLRNKANGEYVYAAYQEDDKIHLTGSSVGWLDPSTEAHLCTLTTLPPTSSGKRNLKLIEMLSPPSNVEFKNTGGLTWEWSFELEEHVYFWRRDAVSLLGSERGLTFLVKPADKRYRDEYEVAVYRPSKKGSTVQVLHYNLGRLDPSLNDKKGQEVLMVITLVSFLDNIFAPVVAPAGGPAPLDPRTEAHLRGRNGEAVSGNAVEEGMANLEIGDSGKGKGREQDGPPAIPPRQKEKTPTLDPNEIEVTDVNKFSDYSQRAFSLLPDQSLIYIALLSRSPALAGPTIKLAEEIKRSWYKKSGEELLTFVQNEPAAPAPPSPPPLPSSPSIFSSLLNSSIIPGHKSYVPPPPPPTLKIFISRVDLGLAPKPQPKKQLPDLRPPIVFDSPKPPTLPPPSGTAGKGGGKKDSTSKKVDAEYERQQARLKKAHR